jgi:transposase-like protein
LIDLILLILLKADLKLVIAIHTSLFSAQAIPTPSKLKEKIMNCPQCQSSQIYRKNPKSLIIICDDCGHQWQAEQVKKALATAQKREKRYPRHLLNIDVYICPSDRNKYSFAINNGSGIAVFKEFESDEFLSGCYNSIEEALEAGINWVNGKDEI